MKTLAIVLTLLGAAAFGIRQNNITADPTGQMAIQQAKALNGGTLPKTDLIADPSGTILLKMVVGSKLAAN